MPRTYDRALEDRPLTKQERVTALADYVSQLKRWNALLEDHNEPTKKQLKDDESLRRPSQSKVKNHLRIMAQMMEIHAITFNDLGITGEDFETLQKKTYQLIDERKTRLGIR